MRLGPQYWAVGALCAGLGLSACGTQPPASSAPEQWQSVTLGPLTVTRSATGLVQEAVPTRIVYQGSAALVARRLASPGMRVGKGSPVLLLSNGQIVASPAAGTVTQVVPAGSRVGGTPGAAAVAAIRPDGPPTVMVSVPSADITDWSVGTAVSALGAGQGSVRQLTDAGNGVYQASVVFAQGNRLKPGANLVVSSAVKHLPRVYRVPAGAILPGLHGGYAVRTRNHQRVPVQILGIAPMTVAVQGNLYNHEEVWVPPVAGTRGLTQSSSFLP